MTTHKRLRRSALVAAFLMGASALSSQQAAGAAVQDKHNDPTRPLASGIQANPTEELDRIDQRSYPLSKTYSWTTSADNVHTYVLDAGINVTHTDFGGRATQGADLVGGTIAKDCWQHTATGSAAQVGGIKYGVAKGAHLVSVRVRDCARRTTSSRVAAGIKWVTANAVRPAVALIPSSLPASVEVDQAIRDSIKSGVTWVTNAEGSPEHDRDVCVEGSPTRVPEIITSTGVFTGSNSDSVHPLTHSGSCVDLAAPADAPTAIGPGSDENMWGAFDGGSGFTAGAAALVLAEHPAWTPQQVHQELVGKATPVKFIPSGAKPDRLLFTGTR
ncbi:S8 family serine peptidase [Amycolatopsis sp. cmx-11-12]|uniref:S8 family serine peptidase n=1 Tax=Amycolatopsis sp. cmx-11-12 TaxID=2785795 RepID=UPI003917E782